MEKKVVSQLGLARVNIGLQDNIVRLNQLGETIVIHTNHLPTLIASLQEIMEETKNG